ncbi:MULTISPECIES: hypothetical protein [unclassified Streptomyces]|uniref:hypothetical protein n=1 Tax=unclassified Streptomyces TaxID=2593676 RepID=UPI0037FEC19E
MALHVTGLGRADVEEAVDCLLRCAEQATDPDLAAYRRDLARLLGTAMSSLPRTRAVET